MRELRSGPRSVPCAGAIVFDDAGRLLLVRRGREPSRGLWCEPSGRCEPGEPARDACVRETAEETGLTVRALRRAGSVRVDGTGGRVYDIEDWVCEAVGGTLQAGDDADDVLWADAARLATLPLVPGLRDCLASWGCLPR